MSKRGLNRFIAAALLTLSSFAMLSTSFEAEARRIGGGSSLGRQSSGVMQQRQAVTPPVASRNTAGATAAPVAAGAAAGAAAKSGASRWLGPIAGIAAGLGIAALLSSLGLSGAFAEMLSSMLLIGLVIFAVMFVVRRLRGAASRQPAMQGAGFGGNASQAPTQSQASLREMFNSSGNASAVPAAAPALPKAGEDSNCFIPGDFDTPRFLQQAKEQFVHIQGIWDSGATDSLRDYLTDDLIAELKPQLAERGGAANKTEVVLLNAELLRIESVSDGHLASVRFSGMLREAPGEEAFRFEEVWNLYKSSNSGWLLAGIQQIPVDYAS